MCFPILVNQKLQIVASTEKPSRHDIRTDAVLICRPAAGILGAFILGRGGKVCFHILKDVRRVINAVTILVNTAVINLDAEVISRIQIRRYAGEKGQRETAENKEQY